MAGSEVFHLGIKKADLQGAQLAIVPGAPERVSLIARHMQNAQPLASKREFTSWLGWLDGHAVIVCSTGIGGPSTSIAIEELAQLGVRTFLRFGTSGAIQPQIAIGDILITQGAVRLDGASRHFAPLAFPAVADFCCTRALVEAANAAFATVHVGISASSDTFYPGQERYDTFSGHVIRDLRGTMQEWQQLNVMNYEMESATLLTMCAALGLRAGVLTAAIVNRTQDEVPDASLIAQIEQNAVGIVIEAARRLL